MRRERRAIWQHLGKAPTNLVIEWGIILVVLLGWPFMAAEYLGGILILDIYRKYDDWTVMSYIFVT